MYLGTSGKTFERELNDFTSDIVYLQEKEINIHRVLKVEKKVHIAFYPTIVFNTAKQEEFALNKPFIVSNNSIFDKLATLDAKIHKDKGENVSEYRSPLKPMQRFVCTIFNRRDEEIKRRIAQYPYKVMEELRKLQATLTPDKSKLKHCLLFMWDVEIDRYITDDPRQKNAPGGGTRYRAEFASDNPWAGKLPASYVSLANDVIEAKITEQNKWNKIFTPEELAEVEKPFDCSPYITPKTDSELLEEFSNSKFNIKAMRDGKPLFPYADDFAEILNHMKFGFEIAENAPKGYLETSNIVPEEKATNIPKKTEEINADKNAFDFGTVDDLPF